VCPLLSALCWNSGSSIVRFACKLVKMPLCCRISLDMRANRTVKSAECNLSCYIRVHTHMLPLLYHTLADLQDGFRKGAAAANDDVDVFDAYLDPLHADYRQHWDYSNPEYGVTVEEYTAADGLDRYSVTQVRR
jgi:hypothetical protein